MNERIPCALLAGAVLIVGSLTAAAAVSAERLVPLEIGQVRVGGEIGRRIDNTISNNVLAIDVEEDFLTPFRRKGRTSGYIGLGKFIDSLVRFAAYSGDAKVLAEDICFAEPKFAGTASELESGASGG